jgi:hypothetical protein
VLAAPPVNQLVQGLYQLDGFVVVHQVGHLVSPLKMPRRDAEARISSFSVMVGTLRSGTELARVVA